EWYVAAGEPVERLSMLPECYTKVNQILAHRFLDPGQHILTQQVMESLSSGKNTKVPEAAESENQGRRILKKGLEYIEENFSEESLSLNSVAGVTGVSANYFSSVFSQEMGMTFIEYVTDKRMEKAKQLLRQTEKHSGEIAAECGYKDAHYFSFVFKKSVGCTPREYRNGK
ncbi:MAG: AraC family transcriptional regulator, partial [Lachnospiraceae bacterium]|nr:AraC family transcriptional regulator [Lachnospiraceae bacterium]